MRWNKGEGSRRNGTKPDSVKLTPDPDPDPDPRRLACGESGEGKGKCQFGSVEAMRVRGGNGGIGG